MTDEDFRDLIEEYDSAEGYGQKLATRKALMDAFRSARRTVSDAQAECGKSSGEAVAHIQYSDELTPRTPGEKAAYLEGIEEGKMRAKRDAKETQR